jgi:hypothetical protein
MMDIKHLLAGINPDNLSLIDICDQARREITRLEDELERQQLTKPADEVLLEALRYIAEEANTGEGGDSYNMRDTARDALNAYSSKPQNPASVHTDSDSN